MSRTQKMLVAAVAVLPTALVGAFTGAAPGSHTTTGRAAASLNTRGASHAKVGMRKARVHAIFDTRGTFHDGQAGGYTRQYRQRKERRHQRAPLRRLQRRHWPRGRESSRLGAAGARRTRRSRGTGARTAAIRGYDLHHTNDDHSLVYSGHRDYER